MFTRLKELVSPIVAQYHLREGIAAARVINAWVRLAPDILGVGITPPAALLFKDGILWLAMPPSVIAQEVQLKRPELLHALSAAVGENIVTELRFRVGSPGDTSQVGRRT